MEKEFVPYELALRLKNLGFDVACFGYYENQDENLVINFNNLPLTENQKKRPGLYITDNRNSVLPQWATSAPTFSQAFTWLRDKYKIYYALKPVIGSKNDYDSYPILGWDYDIFKTNIGSTNSFYMDWEVSEWFTATLDRFEEGDKLEDLVEPKLYEEAEFACLETMVRILENEKKK